ARSARSLAREAGLAEEDVSDLGFVAETDMPALYRAARLLVFPSLFEGFGIPVLEALASGGPVACSEATSLPAGGGHALRQFDPRSDASIAAALSELWDDAARRDELSLRGLARADALRWERIVPRLLQAYEAALAS